MVKIEKRMMPTVSNHIPTISFARKPMIFPLMIAASRMRFRSLKARPISRPHPRYTLCPPLADALHDFVQTRDVPFPIGVTRPVEDVILDPGTPQSARIAVRINQGVQA
jgi:hypothetical protein